MAGNKHPLRIGWFMPFCVAAIAVVGVAMRLCLFVSADESVPFSTSAPIQISADWCQEWQEQNTTIALFRGTCRLVHGDRTFVANNMVVWVRKPMSAEDSRQRLTVYLEDSVEVQELNGTRTENSMWLELNTSAGVALSVRGRIADHSGQDDPMFQRAIHRREGSERVGLRQTQMTVATPQASTPPESVLTLQQTSGLRRVRVSPRSFAMPFNIQSSISDNSTPREMVTIITGGVNVLVDGIVIGGEEGIGAIDLSADRAVIWTDATDNEQFSQETLQRPDSKLQMYLEGNIVVRQQLQLTQFGGQEVRNKVTAERAFYDGRENRALILDAELQSYVPKLDAAVRIRAERLRQNSTQSYHAQNAWFTTSNYGKPGYRVQASDIFLESRPTHSPTSLMDPQTGQLAGDEQTRITILNSQLVVGDVPLFYLPKLSFLADDYSIPLIGVDGGDDRIFGAKLRTRWDAFQLFGLQRPEGLDANWALSGDYLSQRGPAIGTDGKYGGIDAFGNIFGGTGLAYYINDSGDDNLGSDRRALAPETTNRGILQGQHRHFFEQSNLTLDAEVGIASDRNFREQYRRREFDSDMDLETLVNARQVFDENWQGSLLARSTINEFENNTAWLPRGDLYSLGEPLLGGLLNWSSHTSAAFASLHQADAPTNPNDAFTPLSYYTDASGLVAMSRHEVEMPFSLGPIKVAPYAMGEAAFWSDGLTAQSIDRFYGRGGIRASTQFGRVFPQVQSDIFNLSGLTHKVVLDADYSYSESSRDLSEIAQWNEFDDDAQERFRERMVTTEFSGTLPNQLDPRFYAVRTGAGSNVTSPYHELVDNQQVLRLGMRQRLQTKVGPPERQRLKDWMTLDLGLSYFPDANRDNFGNDIGLVSSRYVWNVGDRTSIIAGSLYDFFDNGQQLWHCGVQSQRSLRGSMYVGLRQVKTGSINSQIVTASYGYTMSPKWVSTMSTAFDFGEGQNRGQSLTVTRVGEWLLFHVGANYDASQNNPGIMLSIEPKLGGRSGYSANQLSSLPGIQN